MEQYHLASETPLRFHKFFWYVSLPLGIVISVDNTYNSYLTMESLNWLYISNYTFDIARIVVIIFVMKGFANWSLRAYYGVMILLLLNVTSYVIVIIAYMIYQPMGVYEVVGKFIANAVGAALIGLYYSKRKPLFINR
jgi:hypothetical protein